MIVLQVFTVIVLFPLGTWAFGASVLGRFTKLDAEERFATSAAVSIATLAASQFIAFLLDAQQLTFNATVLALMAMAGFACHTFHKRQVPVDGSTLRPLPALWSLGFLHLLLIQALLPVYAGSAWYGDWHMHYETAQIFRGLRDVDYKYVDQYSLASRTPVFNLATAYVMSLVGDEYYVYQLTSTFLSYCFVAPLYLVLRDLAGTRVARLALVLAPLNLWLMHLAWFTWSKTLAAYFLFMGLHAYLRFVQTRQVDPVTASRYLLGAWAALWLGFLTHQVGLVYMAALAVHALWLAARDRGAVWLGIRPLARLTLIAIVLVGPWYGWLFHRFGTSEVRGRTPVTQMDTRVAFSITSVLSYMWYNFHASFLPRALATSFFPEWNLDRITDPPRWRECYDGLTQIYFSLATGALSVSLTLYLLIVGIWRGCKCLPALFRSTWRILAWPFRLVWNRSSPCLDPIPLDTPPHPRFAWTTSPGMAVGLFVIFGLVGGMALHPRREGHGIAHSAQFPAVILLASLAWLALALASKRWALLVVAGMVLEFLLMFWSHVWYITTPEFVDPTGLNVATKRRESLINTYDLIGQQEMPCVVAAVALEACFIYLAVSWLRGPTSAGSDIVASTGKSGT